jgi:hypothetical protein
MVGLERGWRVWRRKTPELRRLGMNSRNSSTPPAGLDRDESGAAGGPPSGEHSKGPQAGGQPGRKGMGLVPAATPDRTETPAPPGECSGCGGDLTNAADAGELGAGVGLAAGRDREGALSAAAAVLRLWEDHHRGAPVWGGGPA